MKVAMTGSAEPAVAVQVPKPEHAPPLQLVKMEGGAGMAVSVTDVAPGKA